MSDPFRYAIPLVKVRPSRWRGLWTSNPVTIEPEDSGRQCRKDCLLILLKHALIRLWAQPENLKMSENQSLESKESKAVLEIDVVNKVV